MVPASRVMAPIPAPTATSERPIGRTAATSGAEHDEQDQQGDEQADGRVAGAAVLGVEEDGVAAELDPQAGDVGAGDRVREDGEGRLAHLALGDVEGDLGVPDPAVLGDRCRRRTGRPPPRRARGRRRRPAPSVDVARGARRGWCPPRPRRRPGPCPWPPRGSSRRAAAWRGRSGCPWRRSPRRTCRRRRWRGSRRRGGRAPSSSGAPGMPRARHRDGPGQPVHGRAFREAWRVR